MKKVISTIISICCIAAAFTSCGLENIETSSVAESAAEVNAKPTSTVEKTKTTTSPKAAAEVTTAAQAAESQETDESNTVVEDPVSNKKIENYKKEGTVYRDDCQMMCANLSYDEDGYHLAMTYNKEYKSEDINWFVTFEDFGEAADSFIVMDDGTQIESDNITVTGCLECLRILDVSKDGKKAYDLAFYPVNKVPGGISPKSYLASFEDMGTLDKYENKDTFYNDTMPDFLDDNQKKLFANAEYMMFNINISRLFNYDYNESYTLGNNLECYSTGIAFRSFIDYSESIFTPQFSASVFDANESFNNICGELCIVDAERGADILYTGRSFELISENDNEIKFRLIAHHSYKDVYSAEEYNNLPENEREFDKEYTFTMVNTHSGWRFSEFNYWR